MPRARPDPVAAALRLAAVARATPVGGWVPPPVADGPSPAAVVPDANDPADERAAGIGLPETLAALVPPSMRGGRWDPGRQGVAALVLVAVLAAALAGVVLLRGRAHEVAPPPLVAASAAPGAGGPQVVVDVAGRVRHPGIVRLPLGARVDDAVRAAGGPLPGATFDGLNRARKLADGEQVLVGVPPAAGTAGGTAAGGGGLVDLNLADAAALDTLPGIGPVLAQKIVDWRTEHGRFASVDQLREVGGIGESKFAAVKNKVRV